MSTLADLLGQPEWAVRIQESLNRITYNQEILMATVTDALQGWADYVTALKGVIADLSTQLEAANATAEQLKATDAAEDAAQAQQLQDQIAQQIADALAAAQEPVEAPPVVSEPVESQEPETVEPPAVEEPEPTTNE